MPPVVRLGDSCTGHGCWPSRSNDQGSPDVVTNNLPTHRLGDHWVTHCCPPPCHDSNLAAGDPTVLANNLQVGRIGDPIACGSTCATGSPNVISGGISSSPINSYSIEAVRPLISRAGRVAPFDEPVYTFIPPEYPADVEPSPVPVPVPDETEPEKEIPPEIPSCGDFTEVDYDAYLSQNFQVRSLSISALFAHSIKSQCGFTDLEILCNLKALCENVLEPIWSAYPNFRINSGFRSATRCRSQHEKGMAADLQWPGIGNKEYLRRSEWIRDNILFDQEIMEHGNSIWVHVSYNRLSSQRRSVLTMYRQSYTPGLTLHYA
jgi:uncharacterized Zn-binding protein involved in type VI secretion